MIDDAYILSLYFNKEGKLNSNYLKIAWIEKHPEIKDYFINRFREFSSYRESLARMYCHVEEIPVCPICGTLNHFKPGYRFKKEDYPYTQYCCNKCKSNSKEVKDKKKQTCISKYNAECPFSSNKVKQRIEDTNLKRYGVKYQTQRKDIITQRKQTYLEKYGSENIFNSATVKEKTRATCLKKYGDEIPMNNKEVQLRHKESCHKHYGVNYPLQSEYIKNKVKETQFDKYGGYYAGTKEFLSKQYNTKRKNHSFKISRLEDELYNILYQHFDVKRQYKSKEYPYSCDFYIPSLNLYIEYNGSWTHGKHPYDKEKDIGTKNILTHKAEQSNFYLNALKTWTVRDPRKRETAKTNKLNYLEIFPYVDLNTIPDFIETNFNENTRGMQIVIGTDNSHELHKYNAQ